MAGPSSVYMNRTTGQSTGISSTESRKQKERMLAAYQLRDHLIDVYRAGKLGRSDYEMFKIDVDQIIHYSKNIEQSASIQQVRDMIDKTVMNKIINEYIAEIESGSTKTRLIEHTFGDLFAGLLHDHIDFTVTSYDNHGNRTGEKTWRHYYNYDNETHSLEIERKVYLEGKK